MKRVATLLSAITAVTALGAGAYAATNLRATDALVAATTTTVPVNPSTTIAAAAAPAVATDQADRLSSTITSVPASGQPRIELARPNNAICVATPAATPAEELNNLMTGVYGPLGDWLGADIGGSLQIGDSTQWVFFLGDSMYAPNDGITLPNQTAKWGHNSALVQDGHCYWIESTGGSDRSLVEAPAGNFYWPEDGYVRDGKLYLALIEGHTTGGGLFGFETFDTDLAVFNLPSLQNPTIIETGPWDNTALGYLDIFAADTNGTDRIVPVTSHDPAHPGVYLARISDESHPEASWEWWNGNAWETTTDNVADVAVRSEGDNPAIRPFQLNGKWVAMAWSWTAAGGITTRINTADEVTGTYTEVSRTPIAPLAGQTNAGIQYWHTLEGTYPAGDGLILGEFANSTGELPAPGSLLAYTRPTFFNVTAASVLPA